jgi:hypothetical protein
MVGGASPGRASGAPIANRFGGAYAWFACFHTSCARARIPYNEGQMLNRIFNEKDWVCFRKAVP